MNRDELYGGIVWLTSSAALILYAVAGLRAINVPGIENLVHFAENSVGYYLAIAAFVTIFIEGLYLVGSFIPGSSLVVILAVLAQVVSLPVFIATASAIYLGWCLAGVVNIYGAYWYRSQYQQKMSEDTYTVEDKPWLTWFPAFRANYEVAQVIEGAAPRDVLQSALRVRLYSGIATTLGVVIIPFVLDINEVSNEEGFWGLLLIAGITFSVGAKKIYTYKTKR